MYYTAHLGKDTKLIIAAVFAFLSLGIVGLSPAFAEETASTTPSFEVSSSSASGTPAETASSTPPEPEPSPPPVVSPV